MTYRDYDYTHTAPQKYSNMKSYFARALSLLLIILVAVTLISGIVGSHGGPSRSDHRSGLPSGVTELNATNYIVRGSKALTVGASSLCLDTDQNGTSVLGDKYLPSAGLTFIQCAVDQHWNVNTKVDPNLPTVVERLWINPTWDIGVGAAAGLLLIPGLFMMARDRREYHRKITRYRASLEDIRRETRLAFANDEIDQVKMIATLDKLYNAGVKPEGDARLPREIKALDSYGKP